MCKFTMLLSCSSEEVNTTWISNDFFFLNFWAALRLKAWGWNHWQKLGFGTVLIYRVQLSMLPFSPLPPRKLKVGYINLSYYHQSRRFYRQVCAYLLLVNLKKVDLIRWSSGFNTWQSYVSFLSLFSLNFYCPLASHFQVSS